VFIRYCINAYMHLSVFISITISLAYLQCKIFNSSNLPTQVMGFSLSCHSVLSLNKG